MLRKSLFTCLLVLLIASISSANVPQLINYQGRLTDGNGNPLNASISIQFKIYDSETNGNVLWSETQTVNVADGLFSVLLGSVTPIQTSVFNGDDRYLALKVGNDSEMVPRKRLVSVGYSFLSYNSDKLDGKESSTFVQSVNNVTPNSSGNVDLVAGSNVSITPDGANNQITISTSTSAGDNLGDHTATENIKLNGNWLSGDGGTEGVYIDDDGKVGIGASSPYLGLHVRRVSGFPTTFGVEWQQAVISGEPMKDWFYYAVGGIQVLQGGVNMVRASGSGLRFCTQDEIQSGEINEQMRLTGNGNVGIGVTNPQAKLEVSTDQDICVKGIKSNGNYGYLGGPVGVYGAHSNGNHAFLGDMYTAIYAEGVVGVIGVSNSVGPAILAVNKSSGDLFQGKKTTGGQPVFKVDNNGTTTTKVLEITGGSDLAEPFNISGSEVITPGMVVAIDPEHPGKLRVADTPYDRTVAGIISGANGINPGMTMSQEGTVSDGSLFVALTGRVYALADASNGSIKPGDLLTTSHCPGHAMKVTDYSKAHGAILGKAMSSLDDGQGLVLVLVTLH